MLRKAIERHAVAKATAYFVGLGYDVEDVGATEPYDLVVTNPDEARRVEVQGSTQLATTV